ncbi:ABC-type glycerol-3-phosphate transport system, substrate-binding protein [Nocardioides terrae]|uniref:ABC-type glycerol-3-phosphate transport system, substrate-binding protein n=1 Tax=Nocardioides terrae TaxID=574651 RepID=A0A1I1HC23_9ACTN|nr:extracellular solute-binding protein [Nocardioides terrae]SFC19538.1 ABC-type glycerol-3-phosphate transport system, substrate-binding protein [Nocardioides terrae]
MRRSRLRTLALTGTAVAMAAALAACGGGSSDSESKGKGVTITVEGWRPGDQKATIDYAKKQAAAFHKLHPSITIVPKEWQWNAQTFSAQLAGGTLPISFRVPFTDTKGLVERHQVADVDAEVRKLSYFGQLNPNVLAAATGADGKVYGLPSDVYANALHYNRELFTQAGLDPDKPPTTWDELRADAKAITDKTGVAGYGEMTKSNTGGWILSTLTYAMGGRMESEDGKTATLDNPASEQALQLLHDMRWTDGSISSNNSYDWASVHQAFASGKIAMFVSGSDVYNAMVTTDKIDPKIYGLAGIPVSDSADAGALGGGSVNVVSAKASKAEAAAAVQWADFFRVAKYSDQDAAVADAKATADSDQPVGTPTFSIFDEASYTTYQGWIKDYVNVPLDQMKPYTDAMFAVKLIAEPPAQTQGVYGAMDSVVQKVLTDKNADIPALLQAANDKAQQLLDQG